MSMSQGLQGMNPSAGGMSLFGQNGINQPGAGAKMWNPVAAPMQKPTPQRPQISSDMTPDLSVGTYKIPGASIGSGSGGGSGSGPNNPYLPAPKSAYAAMTGDANASVGQDALYRMLFQGY